MVKLIFNCSQTNKAHGSVYKSQLGNMKAYKELMDQ